MLPRVTLLISIVLSLTASASADTPRSPTSAPAPQPPVASSDLLLVGNPAAAPAPAPAPALAPATAPLPPANVANTPSPYPLHRAELGVRVGAMLSGEITPEDWPKTRSTTSSMVAVDLDLIGRSSVTIGFYSRLASLGVEVMDGDYEDEVAAEASGIFLSGGLAGKTRIALGENALLRLGVLAGPNIMSVRLEDDDDVTVTGVGLNIGLTAELMFRVSAKLGFTAQIGFVSQIAGTATLDDGDDTEDTDFKFAPLWGLTFGPEFHL